MGQKVKVIQSSFNKGELSPRLIGRVDNRAYYRAYDYSYNMRPYPEGAIGFREGTVYVSEVKDSSKTTIIRPFKFSTVQNYVIEFGDQYVRFYRNRGQVESGGSPYEIVTPYLEADLRELYLFQSADVLYILHPDYQPRKLIRSSDTSWALEVINFIDGPYYPLNSTQTTLAISSGVMTASTSLFSSTDVGRNFRIKNGSAFVYGTIDTYNSATSVDVTTYETVRGTASTPTISATADWRLGVFGGNQGWPSVGTIYEERLMLAKTSNLPSTVWGSVTGDFDLFSPSSLSDGAVEDDDGFSFTIADDQVNAINWMSSGRTLLIGTTGGVHSMLGGTNSGYSPITPTNVTVKRETNYGSKANVRVFRIGNAVLHPSQTGRKLREVYYEFGIDSYVSRDTTMFSEHITKNGIIDIDYQEESDPYLWACTSKGELISLLYERQQEIEGWSRYFIGGSDVKVQSVSVIPKPADESDDVWLIVERTIDGATVKYIEYLSDIYSNVEAPIAGVENGQYAKYLDSCITYDGYRNSTLTPSAVSGSGVTFTAGTGVFTSGDVGNEIRVGDGRALITAYSSATEVTADVTVNLSSTSAVSAGGWCVASKTFSGLDHLEGETVGVQVDGVISDDVVVSSGAVEIEKFACVVHIGLKYSGYLRLLPADNPNLGTLQGREKSTATCHVYVTDSYGLKCGYTDVDLEDVIKFEKEITNAGIKPKIVSGLFSVNPPSGYARDEKLQLTHDVAMPLTINYIVQDLDVNA